MMNAIARLVLLLILLTASAASAAEVTGAARVIDGDTLQISATKVRLYGVDTAETKQLCQDRDGQPYACGIEAKLALASHLAGKDVTCTRKATDVYGRTVGLCSVEGKDIGAWLVVHGHAVAYRNNRLYRDHQLAARIARSGMWAGTFQIPADWRRQRRTVAGS